MDRSALQAVDSRPAYFYHAPDGEDLAAIYAAIAVKIPYPPDAYRPSLGRAAS